MNDHFTSSNPLSSKQKTLAGIITLLAIVALGISSYLTWVTWHQSPIAGCSGGSLADCDEVLSSAWSKWLGIPVSLFGMIVYVGILALCWPAVSRKSSWAATGLMTLALLAAGSGVWFSGVQVFLLGQYCFYCLSVHICGLLISIISYFALQNSEVVQNFDQMRALLGVQEETPEPVESVDLASYQTLLAAGLATVGLLLLMGGQLLFAPAGMEFIANPENASVVSDQQAEAENAVDEEPEFSMDFVTKDDETETTAPETSTESAEVRPARSSEPRFISLQALGNRVEVTNEPTLGDPQAEQVLVELMDYTCPHCRRLHPFIHQATERYGDQVCFAIYHVPLSRSCNPYVKVDQSLHRTACDYAKLAISVWKLNPDKFPEFHNWLMEGDKPPAVYKARNKAMKLVGNEILLDGSLKVEANRRIKSHVEEMKKLESGLPILATEKGIIHGVPKSEKEWFGIFEKTLGLEPGQIETD